MIKIIKFSLGNLWAKKFNFFLLTFFLVIGFTVLLFVESGKNYLDNFINGYYSSVGMENKLIVEKKGSSNGIMSIFGSKDNIDGFNTTDIKNIKNIEGVNSVYKTSFFKSPSVMNISMFQKSLDTDVFFMGIDSEMINKKIEKFNDSEDYIPLVISKKALETITDVLLKDSNLKDLTEEVIYNTELNITFGESLILGDSPKKIKKVGKIVGFSDDVSLIFVGIPFETLNNINNDLNHEDISVDSLFVQVGDRYDISRVSQNIKNMGYDSKPANETISSIRNVINIFYYIILTLVLILIFSIFYSVISFILINLKSDSRDNAILFSLGVSRKLISLSYFFQGFFISIFSIVISVVFVLIIKLQINNVIINYNSTYSILNFPELIISANNFILLIFLGVILNIVFFVISFVNIYKRNNSELL